MSNENQEEPGLLILEFSREDSRKRELTKGRSLTFLLQKIKITRNRKQVASHHSRETLSFLESHQIQRTFINIYLI